MNPDVLLHIALGAFAVFRLVVEPMLTASARSSFQESARSAYFIASLAAVRFLGTFFLCTALGAFVALALTLYVESIDVTAVAAEATPQAFEDVASILGFLVIATKSLSKIGLFAAVTPIGLLGIGLLHSSIWSTRGVEKEIQRELNELRKREHLESLPYDERMQEWETRIERAQKRGEDTEPLYQRLCELDLLRRVDPSLLRMIGLQASTRSPCQRVAEFMISGVVHKGMSRLAMVAALSATVLLVPASLVFTSQGLANAVTQTAQDLNDAKRNITLTIADRDAHVDLWNALADSSGSNVDPEVRRVSTVQNFCDPDDREGLSNDDCWFAAMFGRAFEVAWAKRFLSLSAPEAGLGEQEHSALSAGNVDRARREWAREQVLNESAQSRTTYPIDVVKVATGQEERWESVVLGAELLSRAESRPVTPVGRNAELRLSEALRIRPGSVTVSLADAPLSPHDLMARAATGVISAFVDISGIEGWLPGVGGRALSGALSEGASAFVEEKILRPSDAEHLVKASDVAAKTIIADALRSGEVSPGSMEVLGAFVDHSMAQRLREPLGQATALRFEDLSSTPQTPTVTLGARADPQMDGSAIKNVLSQYEPTALSPETTSLWSYDGLFPSLRGQAAITQEAVLLRAIDSDLAKDLFGLAPMVEVRPIPLSTANTEPPRAPEPGTPDGDVPPTRTPDKPPPGSGPTALTIRTPPNETVADTRVARAHSYSRLRGFVHIGGVLIGRDPETDINSPDLDVVAFRFFISPTPDSALWLEFEHVDGTNVKLGPYNPAIAHFALAYAADGRPTTVTMINADPLHDLKILLHPALIDTGLGCRAIRLDQFVAEFGRSNPHVNDPLERAFDEHHGLIALIRKAWADRFFAVTKAPESEHSAIDAINRPVFPKDGWAHDRIFRSHPLERAAGIRVHRNERSSTYSDLISLISPIADMIEASELPIFANVALKALIEEPARLLQPLRERPEYFDIDLLDVLQQCAEIIPANANSAEMSGCVRVAFSAPEMTQKYRHSEHFSWLAPPPRIVTWSGVRERPYELDKEMKFANMPHEVKEGPLRFVFQHAMPSPPFLAKSNTPWYLRGNDETSLVSDVEPWELGDLDDALNEAIHEGVSGNAAAMSVLLDLTEFTVLQRLFRAAFNGRLGPRFPIERFSKLARDTAARINRKETQTRRWISNDDALPKEFKKQFFSIYVHGRDQLDPPISDELHRIVAPCLRELGAQTFDAKSDLQKCELEKQAQGENGSSSPNDQLLEMTKQLDQLIVQFVAASRLRKAIGVSDDRKRLSAMLASCPVP